MFWRRNFESVEKLPTGSSFEEGLRFDVVEKKYTTSLRFPWFMRQVMTVSLLISLYLFFICCKIMHTSNR